MKKVLFMAALACFSLSATAQVSIIPKAGINIANASLADDNTLENGKESLIGFTGGLGFNFNMTEDGFLSIQPEVLYSQKGFSSSGSGVVNYDGNYRLNYLEVPLLLKIAFGGDVVKAYVNAGPSVGYLISGRVKGNGNILGLVGSSIDEPIEFTDDPTIADITELDANRVEVGLNFGGGVGYGFGDNGMFFLDLRYNAGLTDFNNRERSKNQVYAITAGLQIPLK